MSDERGADSLSMARWQGQIEARLEALDRLVDSKLSEIEKATLIHVTEMQRRLDKLNHAHEQAVEERRQYATLNGVEALKQRFEEWKTEVQASQSTYVTRDLYDSLNVARDRRIDTFAERFGQRLESIEKRLERGSGQTEGQEKAITRRALTFGQAIALVAVIVSAVGIVVALLVH